MAILITGGAGFIGSNFIIDWFETSDENIINLDALTYAGNLENLSSIQNQPNYDFVQGSINNSELISQILKQHRPRAVINFAAESHVDRSIVGPEEFIQTNIIGTFRLLVAIQNFWESLDQSSKNNFRFMQISTDEVYGSLNYSETPFTEVNQYQPNSPYSASKASADHLVRAFHHTYNLPVITTNCSNNYGPFQYPEKIIPLCIHNILTKKLIPIYGDGKNIRDWLYVKDHCAAIRKVLDKGKIGEVYNIGGNCEQSNINLVETICEILDELNSKTKVNSYKNLISYVKDRPGHDRRYAMDISKISRELNWYPQEKFTSGIRKTINWYLENQNWVKNVMNRTN